MNISEERKVKKTEITKNYEIEHYKKPPLKDVKKEKGGDLKYRSKEIIDDEGKKHIVRFVIMKKKGKEGGTTKMTSVMHQREGFVTKSYLDVQEKLKK